MEPNYSQSALQMLDLYELPDTQQSPGGDKLLLVRAMEQADRLNVLAPGTVRQVLQLVTQWQEGILPGVKIPIIRAALQQASAKIKIQQGAY